MKQSNDFSDQTPAKMAAPGAKPSKKNIFSKTIGFILGGDFFLKDWVIRQTNLILMLTALAFGYIMNSYVAETTIRKIDKISRLNKELQFEYISIKSQVLHESKQSEVAQRIKKTGIIESVEPVQKIIVQKKQQSE